MADAISRLDYSPVHNQRNTWMTFTQFWCYYESHTTSQQPAIHQDSMNLVFANRSEEEVIYPLTLNEIAEAQLSDPSIQKLASGKRYTMQLAETTQVLCKGAAMVLPTALRHRAIS